MTKMLDYACPAIFRSIKHPTCTWGPPQEITSKFAGVPTLDTEGNINFVHHYSSSTMDMNEADICIACKK